MNTSRKSSIIILLFLLLVISPLCLASDYLTVKRVIDGDTILLSNGERVRLIGVDTPEVHESKKLYRDARRSKRDVETIKALGKKASAFTKSMLQGKRVRLEYDQTNAPTTHRGRHGRLLAYVFLEDGTFLNAEIIRQGYGHAQTKYPFQYMDQFREYESEAREAERGLWGEEVGLQERKEAKQRLSSDGKYVASKRSKVFHHVWCTHAKRIKPENVIPFESREEAIASGRKPCSVCKP